MGDDAGGLAWGDAAGLGVIALLANTMRCIANGICTWSRVRGSEYITPLVATNPLVPCKSSRENVSSSLANDCAVRKDSEMRYINVLR